MKVDLDESLLPKTAEVKNKDLLINFNPVLGWTREKIDEVLDAMAKLRLGYLRTITIVRKEPTPE